MMTTKMKVIKNGIEEERMIAYYDKNPPIANWARNPIPVMKENEYCSYTFDGKCYIYETIEDKQ